MVFESSKSDKPGFFVTGTDTEVGKTLISGALITHLKKQHAVVAAFKPVVAVAVLIMCSYFLQLLRGLARAEGLGTANDFHDFCGD